MRIIPGLFVNKQLKSSIFIAVILCHACGSSNNNALFDGQMDEKVASLSDLEFQEIENDANDDASEAVSATSLNPSAGNKKELLTSALLSNANSQNKSVSFNDDASKTLSGNTGCDKPPTILADVSADDFILRNQEQSVIAKCTIVKYMSDVCPLKTLDFIGNSSDSLTRELILSRTIVSDAWMAENFENFINNMPDDILDIFASVTAIVIHRNIRPSFFLGVTGAIYLDPEYLWQTSEQKSTISKKVDYRTCLNKQENIENINDNIESMSDIRSNLRYLPMTRYVKEGKYALANRDGTRDEIHMRRALAGVVLHELAHAVDKYPVAEIKNADKELLPSALSKQISTDQDGHVSRALVRTYPLEDVLLQNVAAVLFKGAKLTDELRAISASLLGDAFESSNANDLYNYSNHGEDVAMLFEEYMMKRLFGIDREIAFVTVQSDAIKSCKDLVFDYAGINKVLDLSSRVELVVAIILPDFYKNQVMNNPVVIEKSDFSWCGFGKVDPSPESMELESMELESLDIQNVRFHNDIHGNSMK